LGLLAASAKDRDPTTGRILAMEVERRIEQLIGRQLVLELPEAFENHRVEVIVLTIDDEIRSDRRPHPAIAGKMKIHGEIFDSAPEGDWALK
jgi:hypothetical protein